MFVLMGQFAYASGISSSLYDMAEKWLGGVRGGLAMATVAACAGFSAICGSSSATAATMGVVAYPEMKKYGYDDSLSSGAIASGGTLGILIPPSTGFIFYAIITEQSVGRMFAAGIIPGILLALCYIGSVAVVAWRNPEAAPSSQKHSWKEKLVSVKGCIPVVILFAVVLGGMFSGAFSATDAASIGAFLSLVFMIVTGNFTWKRFLTCLRDTVKTSAMALFITFGALMFGNFMTVAGVSRTLENFVLGLSVSKYVIIFIVFVVFLALGCIMDGLAIEFLTVPVLLPIIVGLGLSPIWFGVFMVMCCEIGLMTPPVGLNVYIVAGVLKDVPLQRIFKGVLPFCVAAVVAVFIVALIPAVSLLL